MKQLSFLLLLLSISLHAASIKGIVYPTITVSKVSSVYDGNTFRANLKNYPDIIGHQIAIKIHGIDIPEIKAQCKKEKLLARKAKKFTASLLKNATHIELKNIKRGKYFRLIADVYIDGRNIAEILIKSGLASEYYGGPQTKKWCK